MSLVISRFSLMVAVTPSPLLVLILVGAVAVALAVTNDITPNQFRVSEDPDPGFSPNLGNGFIGV